MSLAETRLTSMIYYDARNLRFSRPMQKEVIGKKIKYKLIEINTKYDDKETRGKHDKKETIGKLIVPSGWVFSFGPSESSFEGSSRKDYSLPLCMLNREGPTEDQKKWIKSLDKVVDMCIEAVLHYKEELGLIELTESDLRKVKGGLNPLYWKLEAVTGKDGNVMSRKVEGKGPTLYPKIPTNRATGKLGGRFYDASGKRIDAEELIGKKIDANVALHISNIYVESSGKVTLVIRVWEADTKDPKEYERLLKPIPEIEEEEESDLGEECLPLGVWRRNSPIT